MPSPGGWAAAGRHHEGIIFTTPLRYHRGSAAYPANLVKALEELLRRPSEDQQDAVIWLP